MTVISDLFTKHTNASFDSLALQVFQYQAQNNNVYNKYISLLNINSDEVARIEDIPFLPIQFFKSQMVVSSGDPVIKTFLSSGTTGVQQSKHLVTNLFMYEESYRKAFSHFYGDIEEYVILALLPSYLERDGSSLIYMVEDLIKRSNKSESGFYLNNLDELSQVLLKLEDHGKKVILIGVSFALLDLIEKHQFSLKNTIVMETGGMKGKRKEMIREELHAILKAGFGVDVIHSEYGMTELLSQAYSKGYGVFNCPPWMKILIRDTEAPLSLLPLGKTGGINVIDLANMNSCSFIATQDLGKVFENKSFEILGRFDNSDIRGCNLLIS
ncbi:acyl transferase [Flavicella sp.]|uniref:LuxE/PaaK family acyltransferase n=1 Tax=Flavicella sp. TaxID=2957742 RepID=UPI00301B6167